jgi:hypothetical protein
MWGDISSAISSAPSDIADEPIAQLAAGCPDFGVVHRGVPLGGGDLDGRGSRLTIPGVI